MKSVKVVRVARRACRFQADDLLGKGIKCPECHWEEFYSYTHGKFKAVGYGGGDKEIMLECARCACRFIVQPGETS